MIVINLFFAQYWLGREPWPGDGAVYLAAGERLNAGHDLYALGPTDRPVPMVPPYYTVPLLYPPLIAVLWRPLAALPDALGLTIWWAIDLALAAGLAGTMLLRTPVLAAAALAILGPPLLLSATLGNVDPIMIAIGFMIWRFAQSHRQPYGAVLATAAALMKPTLLPLVVWQLSRGRHAVREVAVSLIAVAITSAVFGGINNHLEYVEVLVGTTASGTTEWSLAGLARGVGVSDDLARWVPIAVGMVLLGLAIIQRRNPTRSFVLAGITCLAWSPSVNFHSPAILLVCLAPFVWPWSGWQGDARLPITSELGRIVDRVRSGR